MEITRRRLRKEREAQVNALLLAPGWEFSRFSSGCRSCGPCFVCSHLMLEKVSGSTCTGGTRCSVTLNVVAVVVIVATAVVVVVVDDVVVVGVVVVVVIVEVVAVAVFVLI